MHICQLNIEKEPSLKAVFNPEKGMNLMSFCKGDVEAIDQSTLGLFEERMAGLGALIGPHFHHRKDSEIPPVKEDLFPFIEGLKERGQKEYFSHGIARYVPWRYKADDTSIKAYLSSNDEYQGVKLFEIEGQSFELEFEAELTSRGLSIIYKMQAEKPSVIGLHYYYALCSQKGIIEAPVKNKYHSAIGWQAIKSNWLSDPNQLKFTINPETKADFGFLPFKDPLGSRVSLETSTHQVVIDYECDQEENSWQLYHPENASYVCIEPVSATNPRDAKNSCAILKVNIQIL